MMTLEFDKSAGTDAASTDSLTAKLAREVYVVGGGLWDGVKERASEARANKEKLLPQMGLSAGVGAVLSLAQGEAGVVKLGAEITGAAFTAGFVKDLLSKERLSSLGSALKDTWNSAGSLDNNRAKIAAGAGQFAFDTTLMMGSGALGAAVARGSRLALKLDLPLSGSTPVGRNRLEYTLGRNDGLMVASARRMPFPDVFPEGPLAPPRHASFLTDEALKLPLQEISNRERIDWPKGAPSGADLEWEPSKASIDARRDAQQFVDRFMQRDYTAALRTAVESKMMERVELNPRTKKTDVRLSPEDFQRPDWLCERLDQLCDLGKFDWKQKISTEVGDQHLAVVIPRPIIDLPSGHAAALVDFVARNADSFDDGYKVVFPDKTLNGEALSPEDMQTMNALRRSQSGQRIIAETALIAFEESIVHLNQHANANGEIISPSFAQFAKHYAQKNESRTHLQAFVGAISRGHPLRTSLYEQEVPALLYDAGMPLPMVERHYFFGSHHVPERAPVMDFLNNLDNAPENTPKA